MAFQLGEVVQLKSGGPRMTVDSIDGDGVVNCIWFEKNEQKFGSFKPHSLESAGSGGGGGRVAVALGSEFRGGGGPQDWMK
jgi:uncharacterized protein YodC (DUF2158 family)